jgi:uncharacterized protein YaiI (UPF0178 family)
MNKIPGAIWVDADACPVPIKEMLFKAAARTGMSLTLIANHSMRVPSGDNIRFILVPKGYDVADNRLTAEVTSGDLVVTSDIPLAAELIEKGAEVVNPRGDIYSVENIKARLTMRDFMETMRASGVQSGGPAPLSAKDRQKFAGVLDRYCQSRH